MRKFRRRITADVNTTRSALSRWTCTDAQLLGDFQQAEGGNRWQKNATPEIQETLPRIARRRHGPAMSAGRTVPVTLPGTVSGPPKPAAKVARPAVAVALPMIVSGLQKPAARAASTNRAERWLK